MLRQRATPNAVQLRRSQGDDTLWLALLLVFPTIGFEQVLHTTPAALVIAPAYEALHWLSDSLLALPLAAAAVWSGHRLARHLGYTSRTLSGSVAHAALIAFVFALLLVPGAYLHEAADNLTHAHATLAIHAHGVAQSQALASPANVVGFVTHAMADGVTGQAIGLPLASLALLGVRARRVRYP